MMAVKMKEEQVQRTLHNPSLMLGINNLKTFLTQFWITLMHFVIH